MSFFTYAYYKIKVGLKRVITRDFHIHRDDTILMVFEALLFTSGIAFFINFTGEDIYNRVPYTQPQIIAIYIVAALSVLFGGILVDLFVKRNFLYEGLAVVASVSMLLMVYINNVIINFVFAIFFTAAAFLMGVKFFTDMINKTTMLNRARTVAFVTFIMVLFAAPLITFVNTTQTYDLLWTVTLLLTVLLIIIRTKIPNELIIGEIRDLDIISPRNFVQNLKANNTLTYLYCLGLSSAAFGFYVSHILRGDSLSSQIMIIVLVAVISLPAAGLLLDNLGRKPMVYLAMLAVGVLSIFFDYSTSETFRFYYQDVMVGVYAFAGVLILVLCPVLAGDNASTFSRGRIMGVFLFVLVMGIVIGIQIQRELLAAEEYTYEKLVRISDWATLLVFISVIIVSRAREPFNLITPDWRDYLDKIYVASNTGIGLYACDFKNPLLNDGELNNDLVSGGISGIQSMLKEISHSKKNIKVLDHGDLKLIFQYGDYSMSVLFVEKDLIVYREKLAAFHQRFEYENQEVLQQFRGNVSKLKGVDDLRRTYFT